MGFFSRLAQHEALFQGMSDRLNVDSGQWVGAHAEHVGDYRNAVLSCTACRAGDACVNWQADHPKANAAPDFCRNKRMLDALSQA
jgi:hypothetical protein